MKRIILLLFTFLFTTFIMAQVGIGTPLTNPSAQLDVVSSNSGVLLPRIALQSTSDTTTITNGNVEGLLIYNTTSNSELTPGYYFWSSNSWARLVNEALATADLDPVTGVLTFTDEDGTPKDIDLKAMIPNFETVTALSVDATTGELTFADEDGADNVVDLKALIAAQEALTTFALNADGKTLDYVDEAGTASSVDLETVIDNFETVTTISQDLTAKTITYTDEDGIDTVLGNSETVTTLLQLNGQMRYTSEDATVINFNTTRTGVLNPNTSGVGGVAGDLYVHTVTNELYTHNGLNWTVAVSEEPWFGLDDNSRATDNTENMYVKSDWVGIGTDTAPTYGEQLTVKGHISTTGTGKSVFVGENAGQDDDLSDNLGTFIGYNAGSSNTTGTSNIAMGNEALKDNITGDDNTVIGSNSGGGLVTRSSNTIIGANVGGLSSALSNNIILADGDGNQRIRVLDNGDVGIGTTTPGSKLQIDGYAMVGDSDTRGDATPQAGMIRFNSGTAQFEGHDGTRWISMSGVLSFNDNTTAWKTSPEAMNAPVGAGANIYFQSSNYAVPSDFPNSTITTNDGNLLMETIAPYNPGGTGGIQWVLFDDTISNTNFARTVYDSPTDCVAGYLDLNSSVRYDVMSVQIDVRTGAAYDVRNIRSDAIALEGWDGSAWQTVEVFDDETATATKTLTVSAANRGNYYLGFRLSWDQTVSERVNISEINFTVAQINYISDYYIKMTDGTWQLAN